MIIDQGREIFRPKKGNKKKDTKKIIWMDVATCCFKWVDGMNVWEGRGIKHLTVLKKKSQGEH